jgi:hypothetical protein
MADKLREVVTGFTNEYLLGEFYLKRADYSDEGLKVLEAEIDRRGISEEEKTPYKEGKQPLADQTEETLAFAREEFVPFDHLFSQIDLLLVGSILRDAEVPFFVSNPPPSDSVIPIESQTSRFIKIHVHRDQVQKAHELIDEHFVKEEGTYKLKYTDVKDRLRAFTFNETGLADAELYETVDVTLSAEEAVHITRYAKRLLEEIDTVEKDRIVFYYDNLEDLIAALKPGEHEQLRKVDLLTIIEVLQIYCGDAAFPTTMDGAIAALLDAFTP